MARLVNESTSTRVMIEKLLQDQWQKQGFKFSDKKGHSHQLEVQLIKLLAEVEQGTLSHEIDSNVIVKIQLRSDKTTFSKTFRSHYEEKAPFNARYSVVNHAIKYAVITIIRSSSSRSRT